MSDPADKSDDLIAELARLMAIDDKPAPGPKPVAPEPQVAATRPAPAVRIPGMDQPAPAANSAAAAPPPAARAAVTGSIRIPGMDQPAPVSTTPPVSKFDFGRPVSAAPVIKHDPLPTLAERIAARAAAAEARQPEGAAPQTPRSGFDLRPVSENRSFAEGPALVVNRQPVPQAPPAQPAPQPASDFTFDFGFAKNPPASAASDPIGDLIAAEMEDGTEPSMPRPATSAPIPLKPINAAPRPVEADRFAVSPGTGLAMKPQGGQPLNAPHVHSPQPATARDADDPMVEIESLIGEAVRVELSPAAPVRVQAPEPISTPVHYEPEDEADSEGLSLQGRPAPAPMPPVVPPLSSSYAPRRSGLKDDRHSAAADDAIIAAAAATGAPVNRLEPSVAEESPYRRLKVKPQRASGSTGGFRQYVGMAVAGTLLLAAGLGLYWVLNMGGIGPTDDGAGAPQLTADATPVKEPAPAAPAADAETARSPVLEQMGGTSAAPSAEQLVSTDETNGGQVPLETADEAAPRDVTETASDDTEGGLANRRVRTVTVRPDGTIVSGDDSVAGAEELPVDRPNVPAVPSAELPSLLGNDTLVAATDAPTASSTPSSAPPTIGSLAAAPEVADSSVAPVFNTGAVAPRPMTFPVGDSSVAPLAFNSAPSNPVNAVVGAQTPNGQIDLLAGETPARVAAAEPAARAPAAPTSSAGAYVQMASMPSEAEARAQIRTLTSRYDGMFGGNELIVQQADLGGATGVRYRVRLPVASLNEATRICAEIKASGGDCFATGG